jgi:hypothetical protein
MTPSLRACATIAFGFVGVAGICLGQQSKAQVAEVEQLVRVNEPHGTMVKKVPVKTTDDISLLGSDVPAKSAEGSKSLSQDGTGGATAIAESGEKLQAEMVAVEQQIKDKQKKVEFPMHMFVADERAFLIDPDGPAANQDAVAKRRFEQDELHKETAEIAALRGKLEQMTAAGEKAAAAKP